MKTSTNHINTLGAKRDQPSEETREVEDGTDADTLKKLLQENMIVVHENREDINDIKEDVKEIQILLRELLEKLNGASTELETAV